MRNVTKEPFFDVARLVGELLVDLLLWARVLLLVIQVWE